MNRHPWWYDQFKKELVSGGDLISNFNDKKPGEATYEFQSPRAGKYTFWVRANPIASKLSYRLAAGAWTPIDTTAGQDGVNIAADGKPDLRFLAWFKVGVVTLAKGPNRVEFRMDSQNNNHGYLDCFVLTDEPFQPRGKLKPDEMAAAARRVAEENRGWFPFAPKADPFKANSGFDLRGLNEEYAGQGGFIEVQDSRFVRSKTGRPIRFWAVNGPPGELKDPEALRSIGRTLAKYGVNLVRIHHGYYDEAGTLKPDGAKQTLAVVAAMKAAGVYSHLSIYFPLWLKPKPGTEWLQGYDGQKHPFAALYFNEDFQTQYQAWWKAVLLTPDAAGKRLIDEPALAGVEIINEDSYFFWTFSADNIPDPQLRILETQFADWLKSRYGTLDKAFEAWKGLHVPRDRAAEGRISFRPLWNMFNEKTARDRDTARFLAQKQTEFYRAQYKFLRELGFKGVITASNWTTASPEVFGPLEKLSYTPTDFLDRHGYFGCRHQGDNAGWSIREGHTYADRSALRFEPEEPGKPKRFVHPAMDPHYNAKPSMLSETTFERPNRFRSEAPLYYAAYGALQDSDAIVHFALDSTTWAVKPGFFMQPWTLMSPAMMGQFPAAAMIYRQGLVSPGDVLAEVNLNTQDLCDLKGTPLPQDASFDELRAKDVPQGIAWKPGNRIDPLIHYAGQTRVTFSTRPTAVKLEDLSPRVDRKRQVVTSTTGELALDYGKGLLRINAPKAQGVSGALRLAGLVKLRDITITSDLDLGHILAVSLDGQPLSTSGRLLLQVMTEEKGTNFQTEPAGDGIKRITNIGQDPWLVKEIRGAVQFTRADAGQLTVTALDQNGYPFAKHGTARNIELAPTVVYYLISR